MNHPLQNPIKRRTIVLVLVVALTFAATGSAQVQQAWASRYNGPQNSNDVAMAMSVDSAGNVYVTGRSHTNSHLAYTTIRYDAQGNQIWLARYTGCNNGDNLVTAVLADGAGNVYATGASPGTNSVYELATVKYDSNGSPLWVRRTQAAGTNVYFLGGDYVFGGIQRGFALKLDGQGNLCVLGPSEGESNTIDHIMVKYDGEGNELSLTRYHIPDVLQRAYTMDSLGHVYVTGGATAKFDTNGNAIWINRNAGGPAIAIDQDGNVYLAGAGSWSMKLDRDGQFLWSAYFDGADHSFDDPHAVAVDNEGNVVVAGVSTYWQSQHHPGAGPDELMGVATVKYAPDGRQLWMAFYNLASDGFVDASLILDSQGHVYVTGQGAAPGFAMQNRFANVTLKYETNGSQLWVAPYNAYGEFYGDRPFPTAVDSSGNVYVTVTTYSGATGADFATMKYTQTNLAGFPSIIVSPASHVTTEGSNIVFSVSASGQEPLHYQWRWSGFAFAYWSTNGFNIAGATNANLLLTNVTVENAGDFAVIVSNAAGMTVSAEARLTVLRRFHLLRPQISDGFFGFTLSAEPGHTYSVLASTNLTDWRVVYTAFAESDQFYVSLDDAVYGPSRQFYRVRHEPDE